MTRFEGIETNKTLLMEKTIDLTNDPIEGIETLSTSKTMFNIFVHFN